MKIWRIAVFVAMLGALTLGSSAYAQRRTFAPARTSRGGAAFARSGARAGAAGLRRTRGFYPGSAYLPYLYPDYGYDSNFELPSEAPSSRVVGVETAPAAPQPPAPKPAEALVLELQGNHWVRITPYGPPQIVGQSYEPEQASAVQPSAPPTLRRETEAAKPPSESALAVLVFRDGHQEEIGRYRIMGGTISISTDYWSTGSWTRTVPIADLNIPATLKANRERGTNFRLPSGPYEVMIGG